MTFTTRTEEDQHAHAMQTLAQVVEGIARRGDVTIPEFHVFATPRSSEVFRLIFPEGQPEWPGIVLVVTALAVVAEGLRLAVVSRTPGSHCVMMHDPQPYPWVGGGMSPPYCQIMQVRGHSVPPSLDAYIISLCFVLGSSGLQPCRQDVMSTASTRAHEAPQGWCWKPAKHDYRPLSPCELAADDCRRRTESRRLGGKRTFPMTSSSKLSSSAASQPQRSRPFCPCHGGTTMTATTDGAAGVSRSAGRQLRRA